MVLDVDVDMINGILLVSISVDIVGLVLEVVVLSIKNSGKGLCIDP